MQAGFAFGAGKVSLDWTTWPRRWWAAGRVVRGRRPAGFQYSSSFLDRVEAELPTELLAGEIISFNQTFPRAETVRAAGGRISYYIDATLAAMTTGRGLELNLPADVARQACELERRNYALADRVLTMARWTAESVIAECEIPKEKVCTVLPGANLDLPEPWSSLAKPGRPGLDRPFVLGFVGADWKRKGLPLVCDVRDELARRGWTVAVHAAGNAPPELATRAGVHFVGYLDKRTQAGQFVAFLSKCDVGCLFSSREALGISTLEFLRVGVPVAGFAVEGPADTLPPDAGFRFQPTATVAEIADRFEAHLKDPAEQAAFAGAAAGYAGQVTWVRCVSECERVWAGGSGGLFRLVGERGGDVRTTSTHLAGDPIAPIATREPVRAAARVLWWQIRRRLTGRPMTVGFVNGTSFRVFPGRPASTGVWYYRLPDPDDMLFTLHLLRPGDTFLDGGANVGVWSVLAASAGAAAVAVEPVPDTFAVLEAELAANRFPIPPRAVCAALAAEPGVVRMTADQDTANRVATEGGVEVPARTLDDVIADTPPTLIKLDLEGYEYEALRGGGDTLRSPALLALVIETFRQHNLNTTLLQNIERLLAVHGFHPFAYDPTGRRLIPLTGAADVPAAESNNTIYVRDLSAVQARLTGAERVVVGGYSW